MICYPLSRSLCGVDEICSFLVCFVFLTTTQVPLPVSVNHINAHSLLFFNVQNDQTNGCSDQIFIIYLA